VCTRFHIPRDQTNILGAVGRDVTPMGVEEEGALSKHREEQRVVPAAWGRERETVLSRRKVLSLFCVMRSLVINLLDLHGIKLALAGGFFHPPSQVQTLYRYYRYDILCFVVWENLNRPVEQQWKPWKDIDCLTVFPNLTDRLCIPSPALGCFSAN